MPPEGSGSHRSRLEAQLPGVPLLERRTDLEALLLACRFPHFFFNLPLAALQQQTNEKSDCRGGRCVNVF